MKIVSSDIAMASARQSVVKDESSSELTVWTDGERPSPSSSRTSRAPAWGRDKLSLSGKDHHHSRARKKECEDIEDEDEQLASTDSKLYLMKKIIESLTGIPIRVSIPKGSNEGGECAEGAADSQAPEESSAGESQPREGWGAVFNSTTSHYEYEQTTFNADGIIKTADGKEISFSVDLQMTREYLSRETVSVRAGDAVRVDPLVINYSGNAAELTDMKFAFDINADGSTEDIPFVQSGSGLLALDRNGDGTVNDGSELFGPTTGNGFQELAAYDEDANGWIDESDSVYGRLSLWTKDAAGTDQLQGLKASGIGAIYLTGVDSKFDLKDDQNALNGQVVQSGLYVSEEGTVGTVQQVDMFV